MEYRKLPRGNEMLSTIGIGTSYTAMMTPDEITQQFEYAFEKGVNVVDFLCHREGVAEAMAEAIRPRRKDIFLQMHTGVHYPNNQYTKDRDVNIAKRGLESDLKLLDTDYIDFALISYLDDEDDLANIMAPGGIWDYMIKLKDEGVIHHLGFSAHSVAMCNKLLDMGVFDMFMLSENAAYDFDAEDPKLDKRVSEVFARKNDRDALYHRCLKEGVGITCMKPFCGGKLLDEKTSPFGMKLSPYQCLKYNLDRPGVLSCITGTRSLEEMKQLLGYYEALDEEKDYSFLSKVQKESITDSCIYCGHCQPCSADIDIAMLNQFKDLAQIGDTDALDHYKTLKAHASDCIECEQCVDRCPFGINPMEKVREAKEYFGY